MTKDWIRDYVDVGDFEGLFVEELGWDRPARGGRAMTVALDQGTFVVSESANYRGVGVWSCSALPSGQAQRAIDKALSKESAERVVIFRDDNRQVWRWPQARDAAGAGSPRLVSHEHVVGRPNEALRQRLQFVRLDFDEDLTVLEVVRRLRKAFDSDKVTKSFYSSFAKQHRDLTGAIAGIQVSDEEAKPERRWYGSILLNRLMFIYFMQRKGFLDGDVDYLRNRLNRIRSIKRPESFYEFYKDFLIPLFHEGLGADETARRIGDPVIAELLGDIPYVNGGIFSVHPLEVANEIHVPDEAFEAVFDFFDQWQWHLDDRPTGNPGEINPDVLGYIFEQFVNNREEAVKGDGSANANADKGAYYTKEDVTGYMTANTLVPVFLERLVSGGGVNPWRLLSSDPDRYIWSSVRHGEDVALPSAIETERNLWPRPTWGAMEVPEEFGLPGESWWEVDDRRRHAEDLRDMARRGDLDSVEKCICHNIDLETLAMDVVDALDNPEDVLLAWQTLSELRVVDPTCGSGAFLFASLKTLHRLYGAVYEAVAIHAKTSKMPALREIVLAAERHPNLDYFLLKHAALGNLYGVDLMPEAVEIARLRLFLKLIAQVDDRADIEPLPDLEFNIRCGNVLVGALSSDDIRDHLDVLNYPESDKIEAAAAEVAAAYRVFAEAQEAGNYSDLSSAKATLAGLSSAAKERLDQWWWSHERKDPTLSSFQARVNPFHWMIEFPGVIESGGFDVVLGNPPYVGPSKVPYRYEGFSTDDCPDIYAPCLERAATITAPAGRLSMIVPISSQFGADFAPLRSMLKARFPGLWIATFDRRPDSLFGGTVGVRNAIWTCGPDPDAGTWVTRTHRWPLEFRPVLFESIRYTRSNDLLMSQGWLRLSSPRFASILTSVLAKGGGTVADVVSRTGKYSLGFKGNALYYLSVFLEPPPVVEPDGSPGVPTMMGRLNFDSESDRDAALAILLSKFAFVWWGISSDNLNVTVSGLASTPVNPRALTADGFASLERLGRLLAREMPKHMSSTVYRRRKVSRYVVSALAPLIEEVDAVLAAELGYADQKSELELAYAGLFKGQVDEDDGSEPL